MPGLLKFIELENYLTDLLGIKVDLVMQENLKPRIGKRILREVVPV
jgi:predicted nucleotidyltransferase